MVESPGHIVGKYGMRVDLKNIASMQEWPQPKTVKILYGILVLNGYYWKIINNYGKIVPPLTTILKKNKFSWNKIA